ncbi:hypothetical protein HPP92_011782 [Vanilla planifolia]|uniref:Uncharacterized protein n=1 Tax=Vanilla planifolia TaxID=51239 RepID=A0A835UYS0_VANPL|nr:hypothetical protein HPP92_011782 [Vanilla planifolia]
MLIVLGGDVTENFFPDDLSSDDFLDVLESPSALKNEMNHLKIGFEHEMLAQETEEESPTSPTHYTDRLILFRFSDCMLPVKLRQVIMSDLRLLTLLEAGLPSWVIFFQSYPLFCQFYRPWMRHLARTLYILISLVTVIIGFYDLYKNVPLLKATASRLCGPLFGWIEEWDMISRIRYLGTMLFLQNFEKGLKCFFKLVQMARAVISVVTRPLIGPISDVFEFFSPFWTAFAECIEIIYSTMWFVLQFVHNTFLDLIESLLQPFEFLFSYICYIAKLVQSFVCFVKDLLLFPTKCIISLASYVRSLLSGISFKEMLESAKLLIKFTSVSKPKRNSYDLSVWKALWNDLFSHIFRAIRSITNGLLAFLTTCNRHRLSTYNHMRAIVRRFSSFVGMAPPPRCRCLRSAVSELNEEGDNTECFRCK